MNLEDVIDPEYGLQQDDWSLSKPVFGDEGQLEVVGWSGRNKDRIKFYMVRCNKCATDPELFGDGYFKILKGGLSSGSTPCGCAKNPRWTVDQYRLICERKAFSFGYKFVGFVVDKQVNARSKVILSCELHGDWKTTCINSIISKSDINCPACSSSARNNHTEQLYRAICREKAEEKGYEFYGFSKEWSSTKTTKVVIVCKKHGSWECAANYIASGQFGCPKCSAELSSKRKRKPDENMIESFFASGAFHPDTEFQRSERVDSRNCKPYWIVTCPECGEQGETKSMHLQKGCRPCSCPANRQKEAYINLVYDKNMNLSVLKFGIAHNSIRRAYEQSSRSCYNIKTYIVYKFPDVSSCRAAERECKQTLECGVVLKRDMSDGWTETTWVYNLDKIKAIYEKHGGVLNEL